MTISARRNSTATCCRRRKSSTMDRCIASLAAASSISCCRCSCKLRSNLKQGRNRSRSVRQPNRKQTMNCEREEMIFLCVTNACDTCRFECEKPSQQPSKPALGEEHVAMKNKMQLEIKRIRRNTIKMQHDGGNRSMCEPCVWRSLVFGTCP